MKSVDWFREKANECRALALAAGDDERREQYIELAAMWEALSCEARRRLSAELRDHDT